MTASVHRAPKGFGGFVRQQFMAGNPLAVLGHVGLWASMEQVFNRVAQWVSVQCGRPHTFAAAVVLVLAWALVGPYFGWSEGWQMVINTGTTIVTFWLVFILQHTQTHDTTALHLKLDELIRANDRADNRMRRLEDKTETELARIKAQAP